MPGSASSAKVRLMSKRRAGKNEIENEIMLWGGSLWKESHSLSETGCGSSSLQPLLRAQSSGCRHRVWNTKVSPARCSWRQASLD